MQLQLLTQRTSSQKTVRYMIQTCLACRLCYSELLHVHSAKSKAWLVSVCLCVSDIIRLVQQCDLFLQWNWHQHTIRDQTLVAYQQIDVTHSQVLQ